MKKVNFLKLYLIVIAILLSGCPSPEIILSGKNTLTAITVNDNAKDMVGNISGSHITFSDSAVAGTTQVTVKLIQFSAKASADVNRNDTIPIKKTLAITAENGSIKYYVMRINVSIPTTTGDGMTISGEEMTISGEEMTISGEEMTISGEEMTISGEEMTISGEEMTITDNPIVIGTITGAKITITTITASGATLSGSFTKVNNPHITELGILTTTDAMLNLELTTDNEAPTGAVKLTTTAEQLAFANTPALTGISLSFTVPNLASFTNYYFRGYAAISGGNVAYTNKIQRMTLAGKVRVSDFTINLPYNVAEMNSDGSFRMNYAKDPSPIRSFGVLITSGDGINLELNGENAPAGARLIRGNTTAIAAANASTNGTLALSATIPALETNYSFRGYVQNDAGITYTNVSSQTTPSAFTLIPDDNFRNAILSCINTNGAVTLSGQDGSFSCRENFNENNITARGNSIRTDALLSITQFNYGILTNKPDNVKIRSLSGIEQMVNLTLLNVQENLLSSLDISQNTALVLLFVNNNSLSRLDVSQNTALAHLVINNNSLSSLNISRNTKLGTLNVASNPSLNCIRADASQLSGGSLAISDVTKDATQTLSTTCP